MSSEKVIKTLILDAGPIIKNEPSVSTLLAKSEKLVTTPAVISEIRDATTRARVDTTLMPFLELKQPNAAAVKFVQDFARKTGDLAVLSRPDIEIMALAYELECEKNGGDWRLRNVPGQKKTNGPPPRPEQQTSSSGGLEDQVTEGSNQAEEPSVAGGEQVVAPRAPWASAAVHDSTPKSASADPDNLAATDSSSLSVAGPKTKGEDLAEDLSSLKVDEGDASPDVGQGLSSNEVFAQGGPVGELEVPDQSSDSDSDSEGWITPSNIKRHQLEDESAQKTTAQEPIIMQVATITTDFAMQNVLLQINLNLLSPSLQRVKHLKTFVLRCHACFLTSKDMTKQFCPRCGQAALTRVACSTNANGEFKLHLKKNMQWNHRGDRYSIPKPVHGAANGRVKGGGKSGWGTDLILAEDQKEYSRALDTERREKKMADLMDADYMPAMFSGSGKRDGRPGGRPKVGAGKTVNSKKR